MLMLLLSRPRLLQALIGLFELPEDDSVPQDEHFIEIEDTPGKFIIYELSVSLLIFWFVLVCESVYVHYHIS